MVSLVCYDQGLDDDDALPLIGYIDQYFSVDVIPNEILALIVTFCDVASLNINNAY